MLKRILKKVFPPSTSMVDARLAEVTERVYAHNQRLCDECAAIRKDISYLYSDLFSANLQCEMGAVANLVPNPAKSLVVSIATYGSRAPLIAPMLKSLKNQTKIPDAIFIWIPKHDFSNRCADLPVEVLHCVRELGAKIVWLDEDLGPHNKYFYVMQALPTATIITLDDDIIYPSDHLAKLSEGSERHSGCIIAGRTHIMKFDKKGSIAPYDQWEQEQSTVVDTPCSALFPTGAGGVLYPPGCLSQDTFDSKAIRDTCFSADDLWLKVMSAFERTMVVDIGGGLELVYGEETQQYGLCLENKDNNGNDRQLQAIIEYLDQGIGLDATLDWIMACETQNI